MRPTSVLPVKVSLRTAWFSQNSLPISDDFFDVMIEQLFGEVWTRPGLEIEQRRLLVMGVLAAQHHFATLQTQFTRALDAGELTADQVREIVVHLVPYVGYPSSSDLFRVGEAAIATHAKATGE